MDSTHETERQNCRARVREVGLQNSPAKTTCLHVRSGPLEEIIIQRRPQFSAPVRLRAERGGQFGAIHVLDCTLSARRERLIGLNLWGL